MKRSVVLTLCIILCLALSLGGTIAYLTDTDGDVNVMTLGRVKIRLEEFQRDGNGGLEPFEDDRMILPVVGDVSGREQVYGLPENVNFHDKIVRVVGESSNADAYLRVWIGVPSALLNVADTGADAVHLVWGDGVRLGDENVPGDRWQPGATVETTIETIPYTMLCYDYTGILRPGDVTPPVLAGLYLDSLVDNEGEQYVLRVDGEEHPLGIDLSDGLQIPVLAQAVQAAGFESADEAFRAANMNDEALFDEYLELKQPFEKLTEQVETLLRKLVAALGVPTEGYAGYETELAADTYDIGVMAAAELNAVASMTDDDPDGNQKEVRLIVPEDKTVVINLGAELEENIVIVNEGGNLVINGN